MLSGIFESQYYFFSFSPFLATGTFFYKFSTKEKYSLENLSANGGLCVEYDLIQADRRLKISENRLFLLSALFLKMGPSEFLFFYIF